MKISRSKAKQAVRHIGLLGGFNKSVIIILIFGFTLGVAFEEINGIGTWHSYHPETKTYNICFTPPSGCGNLIALEVSKAKSSIYIQAYGMTSNAILRELIRAKERGVKVHILLDSSNNTDKDSKMHALIAAGINVKIDKMPGIAHNKVMIIDQKKVITGSFNFTNAADSLNAENVIMIEDVHIANIYLQNWVNRRNKILNGNK